MTTPPVELKALGKKIAFSTVVQAAGKVYTLLLSAVSLKLISNYLGTTDYAFYAAVFEYALFFSVVSNLGIFAHTVREMSAKPRDGKTFVNALGLRIVTSLFFAVAAVLILMTGVGGGGGAAAEVAAGGFASNDSAIFMTATILFMGSLAFDYITQVCDAMLQANYMMGRATAALAVGRTLNIAGIIAVIFFIAPATGVQNIPLIFIAAFAGSIVTAAVSLGFVWQKMPWKWQFDGQFMWGLLRLSIPFGIINIFNSLYFRFIPELLGRNELIAEQFSSFNVSFRISQVMSLFSTFLMFSVLPGFKHYLEKHEWKKAGVVYGKVLQLLAVGGVLLVVFGSLLGPWILTLLTSKQYFLPEFWFMLPMMLLLAAVSYGYDLILITLFAFGRDWWLIRREAIALGLAGVFFVAVLGVPDRSGALWMGLDAAQIKVVLIILGALVGETFMVVSGLRKVRREFAKGRKRG